MRSWKLSLVMCLALFGAAFGSISINNIGTSSGQGETLEDPVEEGESVTLKCDVTVSGDDAWDYCQWTHEIEDDYNDSGRELAVKCAASSVKDNGNTCPNLGGTVDSSYANRIKMSVSSGTCGITIDDPQPEDNGRWECHVKDSGSTAAQMSSMDLYVSSPAEELRITDPDLEDSDEDDYVTYNIEETRDEIEVTCTAYGALPRPTFHWYVNDDTRQQEIDESEFSFDEDERDDDEFRTRIEHTMTWKPTWDDLCEKYDVGADICDESDKKRSKSDATFNFDLICKIEQDGLYERENDGMQAEVRVEVVTSGSTVAQMSSLLILLPALFSLKK